MKRLIRKIIKEQISVEDFCLPVAGWGGSLAGDQVFGAYRSKKVEKQADPTDTCKKCKRCTTDCIKCNCCRKHKGVDLVVNSGTDVKSPEAGTVVYSHVTSDGCGGYIRIDHGNGIETKYCHLKERKVSKDEEVIKGQVIGVSGGDASDVGNGNSTHAHLHYEVLKNSSAIDPKSNGYLDNAICETGCIAGNCTNGTGTYVWDNGDKYEGEFRDGKYDGYGTMYWNHGAIYRGEWEDGDMHGYGTYIFDNGNTYTGNHEHDYFEGEGKMVYADGSIDEGIWHEDEYIGPLVLANPKVTRSLQDLLVKAGYLEEDGFKYGEMDGTTMQAIKDIQAENGIAETGIMDQETFLVLDKESRK